MITGSCAVLLTAFSGVAEATRRAPTAFLQDTTVRDTTYRLEDLSVTATRGVETAAASRPIALSVLRPSIKEMAGARVAADLLRDMPGVAVQQTSAGQGSVILRGMTGNQVLLLVDGIPMNNGTYRDGPGQYLATIDPAMIQRVEVIRGPGSVLYGSDAQGGVVNIITRSHPDGEWNSARLSGSATTSNRGGRIRSSMSIQQRRFLVAIGGSFSSAGDLRPGGGLGQQDPTSFDTWGTDGSISYFASASHTLSASLQHFRMTDVPRYDRYVDYRAPTPGPDARHVFNPQIRQHARASHLFHPTSSFFDRIETTVSLSTQREGRTRQRLAGDGTPSNTVSETQDNVYTPGITVVGSGSTALADRKIDITAGGDLYHDRLVANGRELDLTTGAIRPAYRRASDGTLISSGQFPTAAEADRMGLFLMAESEIVSRLRLTAGMRWSRFRSVAEVGEEFGGYVAGTAADLTGQVGLVVDIAQAWKLALQVAEGFRAPNLYDLTNVGPAPGGIVVPNPDATPERSLSTEVSIRYDAHATVLKLTGYRSTIDDFIDRALGVFNGDTLFRGERVLQGLNIGAARVLGFEAEGVVRTRAVEIRSTVAYTHGKQTRADGTTEPMSKIPPISGAGRLLWRSSGGRYWADYSLRWAGSQTRLAERDMLDSRIPDAGTPGFFVQNASVGVYVSTKLTLSLSLENLTDALYRNHASGVDNPGRHVTLGMNLLAPF